ncbi:MAG: hypothetical protein IPI55_07355 [Flavobacteriales bacterium]|nr:hypothetical protein [Flavobacteriales bacterium]
MGRAQQRIGRTSGTLLLWALLSTGQLLAQSAFIDSLRTRLKTEGQTTERVDLLQTLGNMHIEAGEDSVAYRLGEEARALAAELNYTKGSARALMVDAQRFKAERRYPEALVAFKESIARLDAINEPQGMTSPLTLIRTVFNDMGAQEQRLLFYQEALQRYERTGPKLNVGSCHHGLGGYYLISRQFALAVEHYLKAREIYMEFEPRSVNNETLVIGWAYQQWGNADRAEPFLQEALGGFQRDRNSKQTATTLLSLGDLELDRGDTLQALVYFRRARSIQVSTNMRDKARTWTRIIPVYIWAGQLDSARISLDSLNALDAADPLPLSSTDGNREVAYCNYLYNKAIGDGPAAVRHLERALDQAIDMSDLPLVLKYRKELALRYRMAGAIEKATIQAMAYISMSDSLQSVSNQGAVAAYEGTVKERESALEIQRQEAQLRQQRIISFSIAGGLLLLVALAFTVYRGKKRSDALLLNILPAEVANELKAKGHADAKHFDQVTILFTDFKGFTEASEKLSPQELVEELNTCFKAFDGIITARGIEKIKTIGDAYMCAGGLPVPSSSTPVGVVQAALEMQAFMVARKTEREAAGKPFFEMRVGIHTGPVVAGIVGVKKFAYDIWGDTVNTASRMESSGEVGQVNISEATYRLLVDGCSSSNGSTTSNNQPTTEFTFTPRGKIQAKGKGEMEMYFVANT